MDSTVYNYKVTDLVNGVPPVAGHTNGDRAHVYDTATKKFVAAYAFVFGEWYLLGSAV